MSIILHSAGQAFGWLLGLATALAGLLTLPRLVKWLSGSPIATLPLKQQHRLFQGYWNHLERKERYEEMEALADLMLEYQDGKQPTRKQLKPFKLVVKKKLSLKGDNFKFVTTRYITRADA